MFDVCRDLLKEADNFAVENMRAARGGPFGAVTAVLDKITGDYVRVGSISANAVLTTGMGSAHAEDQGLQPENLKELILTLQLWQREKRDPTVIFASSGQSCQACHAKEEIVARKLIRMRLIEPKNFVVAYGATFEDTAKIAGFNDLPYILDLIRFAHEPQSSISMVKDKVTHINDIPSNIRDIFISAARQVTVLARGAEILSIGHDLRSEFDPISTAEVDAIRQASSAQKRQNVELPWLLGDENHLNPNPAKKVTLYTTTRGIGPLMRGEAQWAAVNEIVTVDGVGNFTTQETTGMPNNVFLRAMARGYNHSGTVLTVVRDELFTNAAQREWANILTEKGNSILYNGVGSDDDLNRFMTYAEQHFKGAPLCL